jgi:hypothetical protein
MLLDHAILHLVHTHQLDNDLRAYLLAQHHVQRDDHQYQYEQQSQVQRCGLCRLAQQMRPGHVTQSVVFCPASEFPMALLA